MTDKNDAESRWLARISVLALVTWMPLELLRGVIPAESIHDFIKDPAFGNVATALGAIGTMLAIYGTAAVARMQIQAATASELRRKKDAQRVFAMNLLQVSGLCQEAERRFHAPRIEVDYLVREFPTQELERALKKLDEIMAAQITDLFLQSMGEMYRGFLSDVLSKSKACQVAHKAGLKIDLHAQALHHSLERMVTWSQQMQQIALNLMN